MGEHRYLPAMVGFVGEHVTQHFYANRPRLSPAVSAKLLDAASAIAERLSEHFGAASSALGQSLACLLRGAVRAVELSWNFQVRCGKPYPLGADIVHVGEYRSDSADIARRFCFPCGRVKMLDKNLVHALVGAKDTDCGPADLSGNFWWTRGHGSLLLAN